MFSQKQKQQIAAEVERILLAIGHPEMPTERPKFTLHVDGKADWSYADIKPNWTFAAEGIKPGINPFNEAQEARCAPAGICKLCGELIMEGRSNARNVWLHAQRIEEKGIACWRYIDSDHEAQPANGK